MHAVFARGKRKVFKGPTGLGVSPRNRVPTPSGSGGAGVGSRDASLPRRSMESRGFAITEEEEEEEEEGLSRGVDADAVDKQILEVREAQRAAQLGLNAEASPIQGGFPLEEDEEDMEIEEVDTFSPFSEGGISESGDGYFVTTHTAEIDKGVDGSNEQHDTKGKDSFSGELPHAGLHGTVTAESTGSQDLRPGTANPQISVNMHEEDSPVLKQETLRMVNEGDDSSNSGHKPLEFTAEATEQAADCTLCIQKSNGST